MTASGDQIILTRSELKSLIGEAVQEHDRCMGDRLGREDVEDIAKAAVRETLVLFGVQVDNPVELQRDFARLREWRQNVDALKGKTLWAIFSIVLIGILGLVVLGFKVWMGKTP